MKKTKYILFTLFLLIIIPFKVSASFSAYIQGNDVRIRSGAGTNYSVITSLNSNTDITVIDKTLYEGNGCSEKWYKINYSNKEGYVCSKYVRFHITSFSGINVTNYTARINANNVSVRKSANVSSESLDVLTLGTNVSIIKTVSSSSNKCSTARWYQVTYYGNKTGYVCSEYVTKKEDTIDYSISDDYKEYLKKQGFPESYFPYLNYLHKKHPNWIFKAGITDKGFSTAVNKEEGKNYMQTTNDNYRISNKPAEGTSWFKVNTGVIAFYMDPRNWLTENRIFMFESLGYDDAFDEKYPSLIKSVFGNGKLGQDEYTTPMYKAGKANKVSPLHIASRIRVEVGPNGSDSVNGTEFTWEGKKYSGYYNFFNIGANETTINGVKYSAITRGLAYAAKLIKRDGSVWNNIETSIIEGSEFIANGYINKGQGTQYYQKFNVGKGAYFSSYTHQYQTNIQAPATEGAISYNSYKKADILDTQLIFEIPVYNDMPQFTSLPSSANTNNDLKELSVEGYSLSPAFDEDVLSYETYITKDINKIKINAKPKADTSSISGTGEKEIKDDETIFTIVVKAESGDEKKYTILVHRVEDTTTVKDVVNKVNGNLKDDYITSIKHGIKVDEYKNDCIKNGAKTVIIKNKDGVIANGNENLSTGFKITISTVIESQTLTLSVKGDTSGDGEITILDLLQVQKHILKNSELRNENYYAADTSGDMNVTILDLLQVQKHIKGDKEL